MNDPLQAKIFLRVSRALSEFLYTFTRSQKRGSVVEILLFWFLRWHVIVMQSQTLNYTWDWAQMYIQVYVLDIMRRSCVRLNYDVKSKGMFVKITHLTTRSVRSTIRKFVTLYSKTMNWRRHVRNLKLI